LLFTGGIKLIKGLKIAGICCVLFCAVSMLSGCGVSKDKYEALLGEKIVLEEKLAVMVKT
jgi:hypothetical protein